MLIVNAKKMVTYTGKNSICIKNSSMTLYRLSHCEDVKKWSLLAQGIRAQGIWV